MKLLSTAEAAASLKLTIGRVQQLIWEGRLPAQKIGNRYIVNEVDLKSVAGIKRGRPPQQATVTLQSKSKEQRADKTSQKLNAASRKATEAKRKTSKNEREEMKNKNNQQEPKLSLSMVEDKATEELKRRMQDLGLIVNAGAGKATEQTSKKKGKK